MTPSWHQERPAGAIAPTAPSMRSASASEDKRWIMGRDRGLGAPSLTSSDALLNGSFDYRGHP
jgi:hypothetical protein